MNTTANKSADEQYTPEPGDTAWRVIKFLKENDDEELSAIDIGVKFDVATDLVHEKLRRATVNEFLRKTTNRQGATVWKLGARPLRLLAPVGGVVPAPLPPSQRYVNRAGLPAINRNTPLMDEETRKRNELHEWLKGFEPGDSATFTDADLVMDEMKKNVVRFRKEQPAYYFAFVQTGPGEWGMERRAEAPPTGRRKGAPAAAPVKRKAK